MKPLTCDADLALRAFMQGFAKGADDLKRSSGHVVDAATHEHWKRGFDLGRLGADMARAQYRARLEKGSS